MKKGQIYEGVITKVAFPNKCRIEIEGKTATVKNGVPGQKVRFSVNKVRKGKAEGRILEVLERSPLECEPACSHFADCGGCTYQNLPYETQLHLKEEQVKSLLDAAVKPFDSELLLDVSMFSVSTDLSLPVCAWTSPT